MLQTYLCSTLIRYLPTGRKKIMALWKVSDRYLLSAYPGNQMKRTWMLGEWIVKLWLIVKQVQPFLAHYCGLGNRFSMSHRYKLPILFCRVSIPLPSGTSQTRFSAWRSAILFHSFNGYSQSLQNKFRVIYKVRSLKILIPVTQSYTAFRQYTLRSC